MAQRTTSIGRVFTALALAALLSACNESDKAPGAVSAEQAPGLAGPSTTSPVAISPAGGAQSRAGGNTAPTIGGTALSVVAAGQTYNFKPTAADVDGDTLTYSISGKPSWATFELATGKLSGTPTASEVGSYSNVVVSVSDGKTATALTAFTINVNQIATGSVTLSWTPPTQNEDGSALNNLAGYRIYYGSDASELTQSIEITNSGLTSYVVGNLGQGTTHFAMTAYSTNGVESRQSTLGSKTI